MRIKQQVVSEDGIFNGALLKWIAIISMLIDHIGATLIWYIDPSATTLIDLSTAYHYSRQIGRLAFPIFAFLTIQGYQHTSKLGKYIRNMFIFAIVSQTPFVLAFYNLPYYSGHLNIFFTLAIGIIGLAAFEKFEENKQIILQILTIIVAGWLGEMLNVDYGFYGIALIMGLGILRNNKLTQTIFGVIMGLVQTPAASLAFFPISLYNGKRGKQNKWFFYIFYPAHLLLLYFIRYLII